MLKNFIHSFDVIWGAPLKRHAKRYKLISLIANRLGFRLYARDVTWLLDEEYLVSWQKFPGSHGNENYIHDRKFILYSLAKSLKHVPGDIAECGVYTGASSFILLAATQDTNKQLYGFDSFKGVSNPALEDVVYSAHLNKWKKNDMATNESSTELNLQTFGERVTLFKGWIPSRFSEVEKIKFCLVHIDVDLYAPTKASIEFFYEKLYSGGLIVCDDYGSETCPGAKKAMDEFAHSIERHVVHLTTGQGLLYKY